MLANVVRKPLAQIFSEFTGTVPMGDYYMGSGDVKYHLGTSYDRPTVSGKRVHLSLLANPSHLEARPPVLLAGTRALAGLARMPVTSQAVSSWHMRLLLLLARYNKVHILHVSFRAWP